ncbi:hypothetical protein [Luteococcus japonicus]|uniref:hypothetical protein n=1 Tax=Luteococcus japonicus TaxID=33984 RepID=UPI0011CE8377|nr:hypothetical protein [Luteococcus japonicus]
MHVIHATTISGDWLNNYVETGRREWLEKAMGVIRGLCKRATRRPTPHGTALFPKYEFPYRLGGGLTGTMPNPWYTSFANSRVLNQATRIYYLTKAPEFKTFADQLLAAYSVGQDKNDPSLPWFMAVDSDGYLWPEEYPLQDGGITKVINGTPSGWWGVQAYGELIGENDLIRKVNAGVCATMMHCADVVRQPGMISRYFAEGNYASRLYHLVNLATFSSMWQVSGHLPFAHVMDGLMCDWNVNQGFTWNEFSRGRPHALFLPSRTILYVRQTRSDGTPLAAKRWSTPRELLLTTKTRWRYGPGQPVWSQMANGPLTGWWVAEQPGRARQAASVRGMTLRGEALDRERPDFLPFTHRPIPLTFKANTNITAYTYDPAGRVTSRVTRRWTRNSMARADALSTINGAPHARLLEGAFAGKWTPLTSATVCITGL